jgi:hypothetical protein
VRAAGVAAASRAVVAALATLGVQPDHTLAADGDDDRLAEQVRGLHGAGVRIFVEAGPTQGLADVVAHALTGLPHAAVVTDRPGEHGLVTLVEAAARLAVLGVPVDLAALQAGRDPRPERWDDPPRRPGWVVDGHFVRTASGDPLPKGLRPAGEAPPIRLAGVTGGDGATGRGNGVGYTAPAPDVGTDGGDGVGGAGAGVVPGEAAATVAAGIDAEQAAVVAEYLRVLAGVVATGGEIARSIASTNGADR